MAIARGGDMPYEPRFAIHRLLCCQCKAQVVTVSYVPALTRVRCLYCLYGLAKDAE